MIVLPQEVNVSRLLVDKQVAARASPAFRELERRYNLVSGSPHPADIAMCDVILASMARILSQASINPYDQSTGGAK